MSLIINDIPNNEKELVFTLTPQEMEPFLNLAAQRLSQDMTVKGFREGRAPRNIIEGIVGRERVWSEASTEAMEKNYEKALEENNIEPIGRPRADIIKLVPGNDFEFKITIPVMPNITLPDYKKIALSVIKKETKEVKVEESEVEDALKWLARSRMAPSKEQGAKEELPALDDNFAKNIGDFKSLTELKSSMRDGLQAERKQREREAMRLKILRAIAAKMPFEISLMLIEQELDKMEDEFIRQIADMGLKLDDYLKQIKKTKQELRESWREKAHERVQTSIVLRAIGDAERIEVAPQEIEEEASHYLAQFSSVEGAKKSIDSFLLKSYINGILRNKKVFELLEEAK